MSTRIKTCKNVKHLSCIENNETKDEFLFKVVA